MTQYKPKQKRPRGEETVQFACNISVRSKLLLQAWAEREQGISLGRAVDKLVAREEMRRLRLAEKHGITSSYSEIVL